MTFYTPGLKTHIVDAVNDHTNFQTEFRFKSNTAYLSNIRLLDVGATTPNGVTADYNRLCGAQSIIQSIHLFDGNQLLDQILEYPTWSAFSMYNQSNSISKDMNRKLVKNNLGFVLTGNEGHDQVAAAYNGYVEKAKHNGPNQQDANSTAAAWVSLNGIMPFLEATRMLPTGVFKNLRLVVQYNTKHKQVINADDNLSSVEPILIADEIVDPDQQRSINSKYKGAQFLAIEHDRVVLHALTAEGTQVVNFTPAGFDNKNIHRLLIVNTPTLAADVNDSPSVRGLGSVANDNQIIQIRVNGQNKFPQNGVTRPMERLAILTDTWGTCNSSIGCNQVNFNTSRRLGNVAIAGGANSELQGIKWNKETDLLGNLDYFGCVIADFVQELQIDFTRTRSSENLPADARKENSRHYQQQFINLFGEAHKGIVVQDGGYNIAYI